MDKHAVLIGITGGIGAGKSVVSRILRLQGYEVYDCDSRAAEIMSHSNDIRSWLSCNVGDGAFSADGEICRPAVASVIFSDDVKRGELNALVHRAVCDDVRACHSNAAKKFFFVESAILATSHLDLLCDAVWLVDAPADLRVERVCRRSGISVEDVRKRMEAQRNEFNSIDCSDISVIINDGKESLLSRISCLLAQMEPASPE